MSSMLRFSITSFLSFCILSVLLYSSPSLAQEAGDGPPAEAIVEPEDEGRRLGNMPNDQIRQFNMRRACEQDLPECLPEIKAMIEAEKRNRAWMGTGIVAVLVLIVLLAMREAEQKKKRLAKAMARHRRLGERIKSKWRGEGEEEDPYKESDPLGDD